MALHKESLWFTSGNGAVGIILCTHEHGDDHGGEGEPCAYVGAGLGYDPDEDTQLIMDYGAYFSRHQLENLMRHFGVGK
jgi:hypothetical protein